MEYKEVSKEGVAATTIVFMLIDIIEELVMLSKSEYEKAGMKQSSKTKVLFDRLRFAANDLRKFTLSLSDEEQISFGETCEKIKEIIVLAYDRSGSKNDAISKAISVIQEMESISKINIKRFV